MDVKKYSNIGAHANGTAMTVKNMVRTNSDSVRCGDSKNHFQTLCTNAKPETAKMPEKRPASVGPSHPPALDMV